MPGENLPLTVSSRGGRGEGLLSSVVPKGSALTHEDPTLMTKSPPKDPHLLIPSPPGVMVFTYGFYVKTVTCRQTFSL